MRFAIILCHNRSIGSKALRLAMWSRWSHSAVYDRAAGLVYDTTMQHGGCQCWLADEFFKMYPWFEVRELDVPDHKELEAVAWLEEQLGKGYDWTALVGFVLHREWQQDDVWFCSEHSETFRSLFETPRFRTNAGRITPHHQDMIV